MAFALLSAFDRSEKSLRSRQLKLLGPVLITALLGAILAGCGQTSDIPVPPVPAAASSSAASTQAAVSAPSNQSFNDGTYAAVGSYDSPAGPETIDVSLTLKNGIIQDATYQGTAQFGRSQKYQEAFGQAYKDKVVGKPISSLSLDVVNGASLTTEGFMNAVATIKAEAKKA